MSKIETNITMKNELCYGQHYNYVSMQPGSTRRTPDITTADGDRARGTINNIIPRRPRYHHAITPSNIVLPIPRDLIYISSRSGGDKSHTGTFDKFINVGWDRIAQPSLRSLMLGSSRAVSAERSLSTEPLEKERRQDPRATLRLIIFSRS
ncbi:uncharacterized protein LOC126849013 [Cataglyphis hispanica]|uniref:uncharacterized protein LOC126849013 n=1 Tax=Cataglyphis hispanica TaxID=1086592 RepID=UPI00217F2EA0|nr:uncharacterized protein LOC126849013 [Cataglyphis hispanica]